MRLHRTSAFFIALLTIQACASGGTGTPSRSSSSTLTREEIAASGMTNAYDVVSRLRPNWLNPPRPMITGTVVQSQVVLVYLDGLRHGRLDALRTLSASSIVSMRFLNPTEAASEVHDMGSDPISAVIMVRTK